MSTNIRQLKDPVSGDVFYPQTDINGLVSGGEQAIENKPAPNSEKITNSGGVFNAIVEAGVTNISEVNKSGSTLATYASLAEALAAVPAAYQRGGMAIKFILRTNTGTEGEPVYVDEYVQYRLMAAAWSSNASDWQGVDDEPVAGSENLIKSGGVYDKDMEILTNMAVRIPNADIPTKSYPIDRSNLGKFGTSSSYTHRYLAVTAGEKYILYNAMVDDTGYGYTAYYAFCNSDEATSGGDIPAIDNTVHLILYGERIVITIPEGCTYLITDSAYFAASKRVVIALYKYDIHGEIDSSGTFSSGEKVKETSIATTIAEDGAGLTKSGTVYDAFKDVSKGLNSIARFSGMTGTSHAWLQEVNIPAGCAVRNLGEGKVTLYASKETGAESQNIYANSDVVNIIPFNATWIRGRESTNKSYDLFVYADARLATIVRENQLNKADKLIGKNLLDINATGVESGKCIDSTTNVIATSANYSISNYIPVEPETAYHASGDGDVVLSSKYLSYFDSSKTFISGLKVATDFTTPQNCAYLKITFSNSLTKIMVNKGTERGVYEEYSVIGGYPDKNEGRISNLEGRMTAAETDVNNVKDSIYGYVPDENATPLEESSDKTVTGYYYYSTSKRYLKTNGSDASSNGLYISCYVEIGDGLQFSAYTPSDETGAAYCIYDENKVCIGYYRGESSGGTGLLQVLKKDYPTAKYIRWNRANTTFNCYKITKVSSLDIVEEDVLPQLERNTNDINVLKKKFGTDGTVASSDNLSSDLVLSSFPRANEFGDKITFDCRVTSFVGIMICHGYMAYKARWFEIDNTNIVFKKYESLTANNSNSAQTVETVAHGLSISRMLGVNFNHGADGKATVTIQTLGGSFSHTFDYGYYSNGQIMVKNMEINGVSSVLTDCKLTGANPYLLSPVWILGASFEGVNTSRWVGQLKDMGYFNFLVNAYPGRNSQGAKQDFDRALAFGCPKYIYWSGSNDSEVSSYTNYLQQVAAICQENGITLIGGYKADNRKKDYTDWRTALTNIGCRYINMEHALVDPLIPHDASSDTGFNYVDNWYEGFQSDDGIHPTSLGAKSIAMQVLIDFPEIMQYAQDSIAGTTPADDGNDDFNG